MLEIGSSGTATVVVTGADLAGVLNQTAGDELPPVYATSKMIGLMELAAARAMRPVLQPGELSVGVAVDVRHTAATPVGVAVFAEANLIGMEGKFYVFEVIARDVGGEIGRGTHKRAVVSQSRLLEGAQRRTTPRVG